MMFPKEMMFPWETAKTCVGEMSKTTSVHDVVQSAGRASAEQGAAVADTLSRHSYNVLRLEHCRCLKKMKLKMDSAKLKHVSHSLLHLGRLVLKNQSSCSFCSVTKTYQTVLEYPMVTRVYFSRKEVLQLKRKFYFLES